MKPSEATAEGLYWCFSKDETTIIERGDGKMKGIGGAIFAIAPFQFIGDPERYSGAQLEELGYCQLIGPINYPFNPQSEAPPFESYPALGPFGIPFEDWKRIVAKRGHSVSTACNWKKL